MTEAEVDQVRRGLIRQIVWIMTSNMTLRSSLNELSGGIIQAIRQFDEINAHYARVLEELQQLDEGKDE